MIKGVFKGDRSWNEAKEKCRLLRFLEACVTEMLERELHCFVRKGTGLSNPHSQ